VTPKKEKEREREKIAETDGEREEVAPVLINKFIMPFQDSEDLQFKTLRPPTAARTLAAPGSSSKI